MAEALGHVARTRRRNLDNKHDRIGIRAHPSREDQTARDGRGLLRAAGYLGR